MKVITKKNRELALINAQNTQNENRAETITLVVPEEYESYNKKIVFVTDDGTVWDVITNNEYKITNAITKYKQVDFYIWLTKEVDGENIDFRTKTKTLSFYHNEDASDEITDEEIHGVNTVVNLLEEEIEKVENLNIEATKIGDTTTVTITKKDGTTESVEINDGVDGQDGYTPQKGIDYFTEQDIEEIEGDILNEVYTKPQTDALLEGKADIEDIPDVSSFITKDVNNLTNYTLKTNTGSLIDLEINDTTYVVTLKLKTQDGTIISTDTIDLPLESVVVSGRYDNTTKKVILTLENGSEVDFSVADLVAGLQTEITSQNKLASDLIDDTNSGNKFVTTTEKQTWNNKLDESDLTDYVKNTDYATSSKGGVIKANSFYATYCGSDGFIQATQKSYSEYLSSHNASLIGKGTLENVIAGKQLINQTQLEESQETQDEEIEKLQTENARFKATLPTTTGEGQDITLDKTAELEFKKPPLPMGNSEQESTEGKNKFDKTIADVVEGYLNSSGEVVLGGTSSVTRGYIPIIPNADMVLSGMPFTVYAFYDENKNFIERIVQGAESYTFNKNAHYLRFQGYTNTFDINKVQLEEGSTATSYEPYTGGQASPNPDYPQEITNVTGDVEVVVSNKNLGTFMSGFISLQGDYRTSSDMCFYFRVTKGQSYRYQSTGNRSIGAIFDSVPTENQTECIDGTLFNPLPKQSAFVAPASGIMVIYTNLNFSQEVMDSFQVEKGTEATSVVPHKEQTFTFPLGNEKLMLGDYLADDGIHHVRKQIVLDGSENWGNLVQIGTSNYYRYENVDFRTNNCLEHSTYLSDKFIYNTNTMQQANVIGNSNAVGANRLWITIDTSLMNGTTINDFKTWLSTHNVTVEYELAEEVIVPYTSAQQEVYNQIKQALSYEEQTNISSNTIALFNVEAYQSTKLILKEMATAIVALGGV